MFVASPARGELPTEGNAGWFRLGAKMLVFGRFLGAWTACGARCGAKSCGSGRDCFERAREVLGNFRRRENRNFRFLRAEDYGYDVMRAVG